MVSKLPHTEGSELSSDSLNYIFTGDLVRAWSHKANSQPDRMATRNFSVPWRDSARL